MSMLMLAVVAIFPVTLLAILLLTSGLEGRFVSTEEDHRLTSANPPPRRQAGRSAAAQAPAATDRPAAGRAQRGPGL